MAGTRDQAQKRFPLGTTVTEAKAEGLFATMEDKAGPDCGAEFTAASGRLEQVRDPAPSAAGPRAASCESRCGGG